tara:strand:+ start:2249 stop:3331 length:1083 start_codon:yes stop_codon:yes gene_type:complete
MEKHTQLKYLTDYISDKSTSIAIAALVGKLSPKASSHKSGWAYHLANQCHNAGYENVTVVTDTTTNWDDFDVVLIEHGMEFKGTFNIFGGANDDLYYQITRIFSSAKMFSLHHDMPCIGSLIEKRLHTGSDLFKTLERKIEEVKKICANNITRIDCIEKTDKLCFGDSHSFSQYTPGYMTSRHDGLTMHGALKRGLDTYVYPWIKSLRIYLGNIDVRHHLMRQHNPEMAVDKLLAQYEDGLMKLQESGVVDIEVVHTLPIENESRALPKTGYYKGTPFTGTWEERTDLVKQINKGIDKMCERNGWSSYKHPEVFYNHIGELPFDVMEKPKSVHIAREYYRWDLVNNRKNKKLIKQSMSLF